MAKTAENSLIQAKTGYHHGDLREALIAAVQQLLIEKGADSFTLADACRLAGVSTAAPYRHFQDREEILRLIMTRTFDALADKTREAAEAYEQGSLDRIVAMGHAYIDFAVNQEALFRLMFGPNSTLKLQPEVEDCGKECFSQVIEEIGIYCQLNNIRGDASLLGIRMWTFVHGAASLFINNEYQTICPEIDLGFVKDMIEKTAPTMLSS
ncbi:MAG: TetR/AcrR family transcriptional regulator [Methyloligellaceae bacterium]